MNCNLFSNCVLSIADLTSCGIWKKGDLNLRGKSMYSSWPEYCERMIHPNYLAALLMSEKAPTSSAHARAAEGMEVNV
jgi:hypothetical protein